MMVVSVTKCSLKSDCSRRSVDSGGRLLTTTLRHEHAMNVRFEILCDIWLRNFNLVFQHDLKFAHRIWDFSVSGILQFQLS